MSDLYRDFIDQKADSIINSLGGTITPAPANAELYRDFLDRKFDDVINAIDNVKVKSFTYTGNGNTTNIINFPTKPNIILSIQREYDAQNDHRTASPIMWNWNTNLILFQRSGGSTVSISNVINAITFDDVNNTLTIVSGGAPSALNTNGRKFRVYYI